MFFPLCDEVVEDFRETHQYFCDRPTRFLGSRLFVGLLSLPEGRLEITINLGTELIIWYRFYDVVIVVYEVCAINPNFVFRQNVFRGEQNIVALVFWKCKRPRLPCSRAIVEGDLPNGKSTSQTARDVLSCKVLGVLKKVF